MSKKKPTTRSRPQPSPPISPRIKDTSGLHDSAQCYRDWFRFVASDERLIDMALSVAPRWTHRRVDEFRRAFMNIAFDRFENDGGALTVRIPSRPGARYLIQLVKDSIHPKGAQIIPFDDIRQMRERTAKDPCEPLFPARWPRKVEPVEKRSSDTHPPGGAQ